MNGKDNANRSNGRNKILSKTNSDCY